MTVHSDFTTPASSLIPKRGHWRLSVTIIALVCAVALGSCNRSPETSSASKAQESIKANDPTSPPVAVTAATVRQRNVDVYLSALGTVTPLNTVVVRSRVDGQLTHIAFQDGQIVKAGDVLAQIDPEPFKVQLALAMGQQARDQAQLDNAQADLTRYHTLLAQDSIAQQQVDTQESLVRQLKASLQSDQGNIDNAKMQLARTSITAPISGRIGLRQVSVGALIRSADANGIVTITQTQPVSVIFAVPEDQLPSVMKQLRTGKNTAVEVFDRSLKNNLGKGRLLATDNQIDSATGTIKIKAEFPNANGTLFANQFVNVRMPIDTLTQALIVPTAAIQRGAAGTFVYVVNNEKNVSMALVKTSITQDGYTVIESGVAKGDIIVIDGTDRLREGAKVEITMRDASLASNQAKHQHLANKKLINKVALAKCVNCPNNISQ